jgi:hypothetical protein
MSNEYRVAVIWEHGHWRCEYSVQEGRRGGTVRVFSGDMLLLTHRAATLDELLHVAQDWSRLFARIWGDDEAERLHPDRRGGRGERRRVARGGRRGDDHRG